jgi:hypothetical protein
MWITNDREMAQTLRAIDVAHAKKRQAASHLPLAQKLMAYKEADEEKRDALEAFAKSFPEGGFD